MKKILATLTLSIFSTITFAQSRVLHISNITYPELKMEMGCEDQNCEKIIVKRIINDRDVQTFAISYEKLNKIAYGPNKIKSEDGSGLFINTRELIRYAKKDFKEGYNGRAIGEVLLTVPFALGETFIAPYVAIEDLASYGRDFKRNEVKAAKRLITNFNSEEQELALKHKYFSEIIEMMSNHAQTTIVPYKNCSVTYSYGENMWILSIGGHVSEGTAYDFTAIRLLQGAIDKKLCE